MIIMQLIQDEKLALNDPITKHLLYYRKDQGVKLRYTIAWNINLEFLTSQIPSTTEIQPVSYTHLTLPTNREV